MSVPQTSSASKVSDPYNGLFIGHGLCLVLQAIASQVLTFLKGGGDVNLDFFLGTLHCQFGSLGIRTGNVVIAATLPSPLGGLYVQYQLKVWPHLFIPWFFLVFFSGFFSPLHCRLILKT